MVQSDLKVCMHLEFWTGITVAFHTCRLVRATRQCLENARTNWYVNFKHTKIHQGQWQNECADSLAKMSSYYVLSESTLPLSMARWYQNFQKTAQRGLVTDWNPMSVLSWLQVGHLPDPQNASEMRQTQSVQNKDASSGDQINVRRWKVVTAYVLTIQLAVETEVAGFFASGRRLEFEERIADLKVDIAGIQEGRQDQASHVRSAGTLWCRPLRTGVTVARKRGHITSTYPTPNTLPQFVRLEEISGSSFRATQSVRCYSLACISVWSNFGD